MNTFKKLPGFTLVEIVVVTVILSIFGTTGFISYSRYTVDSRDSVRITELRNIEKGLELYGIDTSRLPTPDNASEITVNGSVVWYQGTFGDEVFRSVRRLSEKPLDPSLGIEYSYSLLNTHHEYELSTIFEGSVISYLPSIAQTYASDIKAYSVGSYNKRISYIKTSSGDTVLALPSITSSDSSSTDVLEIISNNNLVLHGQSNLPRNYNAEKYQQSGGVISHQGDPVIFSGNLTELNTFAQRQEFIRKLQESYNSDLLSGENSEIYKKIHNIDISDQVAVEQYINFLSENTIGGLPKIQ